MKPVELEIFLQDGLTPGLKKAGQTVSRFSEDARRQFKEISESLQLQRTVVKGMEKEYARMEKALKNAAPGAEWSQAKAKLAACKTELDGEKAALVQLEEEHRRLKAEADNAGQSLRGQLRNVREEIATLLLAYRSLTDAEKQTAQGRELARHIDELTERAGELNDALGDTAQAITNAASDTRAFDQLAGGMQLVVDGFGLATAGAQMLGLSEADLVEVQTQLQTALVASNALSAVQVNLQKQSALMQGVNTIQTKAAATAETIRTWAVGRGVVATKAATIAQAAFNAVAKANPYVLLAMAVVTVVGALYALAKGNKAAQKAEEERRAQMEKSKQAQEDFRRTVVDSAGEQTASFLKLKKAWEDLGNSFDAKKRFIADTKEEWRKLGKEITTVNDMENLFRLHTKDMINAIILRAELKAYEARIQAVADEMVDDIEKNKTYTYTPVKAGTLTSSTTGQGYTYTNTFQQLTPQERQAVKDHITFSSYGLSSSESLDAEGAKMVNDMRRSKGNSDALARQQAAKQKAENAINGYVDTMTGISAKLDAAMSAMPGANVNPDAKPATGTKTTSPSKSDIDSRLRAEQKEAEELLKLRHRNEQDEIDQMAEGSERRRRQIDLDYEKQLSEIEKMRSDFERTNKEAGTQGLNLAGLTEEQQREIDRANDIAVSARDRALEEMYRSEAQHMSDYLKEYGTFQQKRAAIAEDYDRRIAEASDEWSRKSLEREKAGALQNLEVDAIKQSIDWGSVFGDFGTLFKEQLKPTVDKLRAITKTDEFKDSTVENKQALYELIAKLERANTEWDSNIFATLGDDLTAYQSAMRKYMEAQEREREATDRLTEAKNRLKEAEGKGDKQAADAARADVETAAANLAAASEVVTDFGTQVQDASGKLQTSSEAVNNMFTSLASNLAGLKSGSLQGVGESLMGLDKLFNSSAVTNAAGTALSKGMNKLFGDGKLSKSVADALGDSGMLGQIISAILSILDILKDGIGALVSSLIDTVLNAVSGILKNLLNGNMFVQIGSSLKDGIAGIFNAITFGGFGSWFSSSNAKQVKATIDRLTDRNENLQTAIEDLTDEIKASKGTKSVSAYKNAYRDQQEVNRNYRDIARAQAGYHGSHHSWNYYFDGFSGEQISRLSRQIGRQWDGSLWSLSPEEMKMLRSNVDMWEDIKNTGKGGYGSRLAEKLDDYISQAGKLKELTDQLYEGLTGISFDSMYDSFINELMDMEASTEDFADKISEYFMRAMLSNKIGEMYSERLEEWWKKFGKAMEDNDLSEAERNSLSEEYMQYVEEAIKLRDQLAAATGYDNTKESGSGQTGKAGSFSAMSQDQGTKLEGLFTSVQGHVSNIDTLVEDVAAKMNTAEGYLARIAENTGISAATATEIKELIQKLTRDGIKTR